MINKIKRNIGALQRKIIDTKNRKRLTNRDFSIISSNCVGGVIYHDLGLEFLSPTINLYILPSDFVKLCKNLKYYMSITPEQVMQSEYKYPVARIDDITIYCMHYNSFGEFLNSWETRKKRINYDNLFFIMSERDDCTYDDIIAFDQLNARDKVVFVGRKMKGIKSSYYNKKYVDKNGVVKTIMLYNHNYPSKRLLDEFDYVSFLNAK